MEVPFAGVETYLFDCDEDLYGEEARVEFYHFVRPECKFDSVEEILKKHRFRDASSGKRYFEKRGFTLLRAYGILFEYELAHIQISDTPTIS